MHSATETGTTRLDAAGTDRVRVAVAGATGFTGQELLRILSRHPHVSLVAATSSGATAARRLPALNHCAVTRICSITPGASPAPRNCGPWQTAQLAA